MLLKYYKKFLEQLFILQQQFASESIDIVKAKRTFEQMKIIFHNEITQENMHTYLQNNDNCIIIQSVEVEINKNLRLLETEFLYLESSRQLITIHSRVDKIQQRIINLIEYSKFINKQLHESNTDYI